MICLLLLGSVLVMERILGREPARVPVPVVDLEGEQRVRDLLCLIDRIERETAPQKSIAARPQPVRP